MDISSPLTEPGGALVGSTPTRARAADPARNGTAAPPPREEPPLTVIRKRSDWGLFDLAELWRYRELLFFLTWRDVMLRYKQTVLGVAWAVLQPLAIMFVFSFFLGKTAGVADHLAYDYGLFVFAGFLPWMFFANAVANASGSIVANHNLVTKVYFPRLMIPMGAVGASFVDFLVAFGMLVVLMVYHQVAPGWSVVLAPLLVLGLVLAALGVGTLLAAATVAYRDFRYVVPFLVQLWMFATPTIYLPEAPPQWRWLLPLNPAQGLIQNFRLALLGGVPDVYALVVSGTVGLLLFLGGCWYFRRVERSFADII
jgi:lipopolysaccharide transport system permease protein